MENKDPVILSGAEAQAKPSAAEVSKSFQLGNIPGMKERFAVLNHLILRDLNGTNAAPTFSKYTKDQIATYLSNPYQYRKQLREAVTYIYGASSHFRRLIQYFVGLSDLSFVVSPYKIDTLTAKPKSISRNYVEQVRNALMQNNVTELNRLLDVTSVTASSTWDLVYAQAALLNLNGNQYNQLINNINKFRSIATTTVKTIRKQVRNSVQNETKDYKSALDDVLKLVEDLIKYEHEQMVDALEDQRDAYQALIDKKKELLQQTKDEEDYGDATHTVSITVDKAGHIVAAEVVEIVGAQYITGLTSDAQAQLDAKIPLSQKGKANGVAELGPDGLVPSAQLPSYVDDVVEAYVVGSTALGEGWLSKTKGGAALTPEKDKIYVVIGPDKSAYLNKQYRWGGTTYVLCNPSDVNSVNGKSGVVTLTQDDVGDGETYTRFSKTDKAKLGTIDEGATKNTITLNGTATKDPSFFAPTGAGTAGQVLTSNGAGKAPTWQAAPENLHKYTITNPVISASGGAFTWTIAAQANGPQTPMLVQVYEAATNAMVLTDVQINTDNSITITINQTDAAVTSLAAGSYRAVAIG